MSIKYEVVAVTGTYKDAGSTDKKRYCRIGSVITTGRGGYMLKLDAIPLNWDGSAFLNDPKGRDAKPAPAATGAAQAADDGGDDIPF